MPRLVSIFNEWTLDKSNPDPELIRPIYCFTGNLDQPIKLKILVTGAAVGCDSLTVTGLMKFGYFSFCSQLLP